MCDCSAVKDILEYEGSNPQLRWCCQELMRYDFVVIHRCALMIKDVDALTRRFKKTIALHYMQAHLMRSRDKLHRPLAYDFDHFHTAPKVNHILPSSAFLINPQTPLPPVSAAVGVLPSKLSVAIPSSIPVLFHSAIRFSRVPSHSIIPPVTQRREPSHTPFTGHQSLVWISIDAIIPTVSFIIAV